MIWLDDSVICIWIYIVVAVFSQRLPQLVNSWTCSRSLEDRASSLTFFVHYSLVQMATVPSGEQSQIQPKMGSEAGLESKDMSSRKAAVSDSKYYSTLSDFPSTAGQKDVAVMESSAGSTAESRTADSMALPSQPTAAPEQPTYATGTKLFLIVVSLALTIFCVAVDNTSPYSSSPISGLLLTISLSQLSLQPCPESRMSFTPSTT